MKQNKSFNQNQNQKFKLTAGKTIILLALLVVSFSLIFNVGNIRTGFATPVITFYAVNDGEWDSVGTWSTISSTGAIAASYPQANDIVSISGHKIRVSKLDAVCGGITVNNGGSGIYISNGHKLTGNAGMTMSATSGIGNLELNITGAGSSANIATEFVATMSGGNVQLNISANNNAVLNAGYNVWLTYSGGGGNINVSLRNAAQISTASLNYTCSAANKANITMYNTASLYLRGNISRKDAHLLYGSLMSYDSSLVYLKGSAQQQVNTAQGGDTMFIAKMLIRNSNATVPQVTLFGNVNITNNLSITSGIVKTSSQAMFVLGSSASVLAGSTSCFVSGPMRKDGASAIIFPVGKNGTYAPIGISAPTSSSTFVAEYFDNVYTSVTNDTGIVSVSNSEYWDLKRTAGTGAAAITMYWNSTIHSRIISGSDVRVAEYDAAHNKWISFGNMVFSSSGTSGSVTSRVMSSFNPITFGSHAGMNALPVSLTSFDVKREGSAVNLKWITASETNNAFFNIEQSQNGSDFIIVGKVNGHGNSQSPLEYNYTDEKPMTGTSYYRLKQVDFNGKSETFAMKAITITGDVSETGPVSPNPFNDHFNMEYTLAQEAEISVQIVNMSGSILSEEKIHGNRGRNEYHYTNGAALHPGTYILRIGNGAGILTQRMIKAG